MSSDKKQLFYKKVKIIFTQVWRNNLEAKRNCTAIVNLMGFYLAQLSSWFLSQHVFFLEKGKSLCVRKKTRCKNVRSLCYTHLHGHLETIDNSNLPMNN